MHELFHTLDTVTLNTVLRHPVFVALVSIVVGTGLFDFISYRRSRRDAMRQQAIEFIDQISAALNAALSSLYRVNGDRFLLQTREAGVADPVSVDSRVHDLFKLRIPMQVKSIVYLGGGDFAVTYTDLVRELESILKALRDDKPKKTLEDRLLEVEDNASRMLKKALDIVTRNSYPSFHHVRDHKPKPRPTRE